MSDSLRVLGVDPGVASTGVALLEQTEGVTRAHVAEVIRTQKATKKVLRDLRISADDLRRYKQIWDALSMVALSYDPHAVSVESYAPQPGRAGGNSWKAAVVYGLVIGFGFSRGCPVLPFVPGDLKRNIAGKARASKEDVAGVLFDDVKDLRPLVETLVEGQREHATDASGHALLGLREMQRIRQMMGVE